MKAWRGWVAFLVLFFAALPAPASVLTLEAGHDRYQPYPQLRHFCMPPSAAPDIEALRQDPGRWPWRASGPAVPNHGYTTEVCWYRLALSNHSHAARDWVLGLDYPLITLVDLWLLDEERQVLTHYREGADLPYDQRSLQTLAFAFAVELPPQAPREILMRFETPNLQLPLVLMPAREFSEYSALVTVIHSLLLGGMLVMILYSLLLYTSLHESAWLPYVCWATVITALQVVLQGFGTRFLWPDQAHVLTIAIEATLAVIVMIAPWFVIRFLNLGRWTPRLSRLLWAHSVAGVVLLLLLPWMGRTPLLILQMLVIFSLSLTAGIAILLSHDRSEAEKPELNGFIVAWACFLFGSILLVLNKLGIVPRNLFTEHLVEVGSFLAVALLSRALAAQINRLKAEKSHAEALSQAKSEFLATMSHEIRTPMNGVLGLSELLRHTPLTEQQSQYADTIYRSSQSLLTVINDILDYSKIEAGKLGLEHIDTSLEQLLGDCVALHAPRIVDKQLALWVRMDPAVPAVVHTDPLRLKQILNNLLGNACKFTERGAIHLRVSLQAEGEGAHPVLRFEVEDSGIGLSPDEVRRLFRSYEQAAAGTSRQYGGTGLGLVISKRLVELLGGRIGVSSQPGRTCFWFTLPVVAVAASEPVPGLAGKSLCVASGDPVLVSHLATWAGRWGMAVQSLDHVDPSAPTPACDVLLLGPDQSAEAGRPARENGAALLQAWPLAQPLLPGAMKVLELPLHPLQFRSLLLSSLRAEPAPSADPVDGQGNGLGHLRVLVAEDNVVNQLVIVSLLNSLGIKVSVVENGALALAAVTAAPGQWDVVLMDTEMPQMDGHVATRRIRDWEGQEGHSPCWIIALSAHATPDRIREARAAGVDDYLSKPVTRAQVLEALRHSLRVRPQHA
jgi:signal transduction histidine kinase/ActR/RegA family two-component response regulator